MSLRPLIKKQKIRIDAHQRGNGHNDKWGDRATDIHIDKRTNTRVNGKPVEAVLRIPINSDRPVSCEVNKRENEQAANRIKKEVKDAFSDEKTRREFVNDLLDTLENYATDFSSENKITATIERLAEHFELTEEIMKSIVRDGQDRIYGLTIRFRGENGKMYFITATKDHIVLGEAESKDKDWSIIEW